MRKLLFEKLDFGLMFGNSHGEFHMVTFNKVEGHSDDELNNLCDSIAKKEIETHIKTSI